MKGILKADPRHRALSPTRLQQPRQRQCCRRLNKLEPPIQSNVPVLFPTFIMFYIQYISWYYSEGYCS